MRSSDLSEARRILSAVKNGIAKPAHLVRWALWVTGDLV